MTLKIHILARDKHNHVPSVVCTAYPSAFSKKYFMFFYDLQLLQFVACMQYYFRGAEIWFTVGIQRNI